MRFAIVTIFPPEKAGSTVLVFEDVTKPLANSLMRLGHDVVFQENYLSQTRCNIIFGAFTCPERLKNIKKTDIIFNLEQWHENSPYFTAAYCDIMRNCRVFDYSQRNAEYLSQRQGINTEFFRIGYDPFQSTLDPDYPKDIDVLFYGSISVHRLKILHAMRQKGITVTMLSGAYGKERDRAIRRAKLILNIQRYNNYGSLEIVRLSYLFSNHKAVVSDISSDTYIYDGLENSCCFSSCEKLPYAVEELLKDPQKRLETAESGFEAFASWKMDDSVRAHIGMAVYSLASKSGNR